MAKKQVDWTKVVSGTHDIPVGLIRESELNGRKTFPIESIESLAESIAIDGQLIAARVHPCEADLAGRCFELIDGARRFRAMTLSDAGTIRCEVTSVLGEKDVHGQMLTTHVHREDLNAFELGAAWAKQYELGMHASVKAMAAAFGQAGHERAIADLMTLSKCIVAVQDELLAGRITKSHAVELARLTDEEQVRALAACFETEMVTIGALPETTTRLISLNALKGWIQAHLRDPHDDKELAEKVAEKRAKAEVRSDGERELEREGERLAGSADEGDHDEAGSDLDGGEEQQRQTSNNANEREKGNGGEGDDDRQDHDHQLAQSDREIVSALTAAVRFSFQGECRPGTRLDRKINELLEELLQARRLTRAFDGYLQEHFDKSKTSKERWDEFAVDLLDELFERRAGSTPRPDSVEASCVRVRDFMVAHFENDILPGEWPSDAAIRLLDELRLVRLNTRIDTIVDDAQEPLIANAGILKARAKTEKRVKSFSTEKIEDLIERAIRTEYDVDFQGLCDEEAKKLSADLLRQCNPANSNAVSSKSYTIGDSFNGIFNAEFTFKDWDGEDAGAIGLTISTPGDVPGGAVIVAQLDTDGLLKYIRQTYSMPDAITALDQPKTKSKKTKSK